MPVLELLRQGRGIVDPMGGFRLPVLLDLRSPDPDPVGLPISGVTATAEVTEALVGRVGH